MEEELGMASVSQKPAFPDNSRSQGETQPGRGVRAGAEPSRPKAGNCSCSTTSSRTQIVPSFLSGFLWPLGVAPLMVSKWLL